jgi:hypothetical protein
MENINNWKVYFTNIVVWVLDNCFLLVVLLLYLQILYNNGCRFAVAHGSGALRHKKEKIIFTLEYIRCWIVYLIV